MSKETSYLDQARRDAWEMFANFADEMAEQFAENGKVSTDLNNDYPNGDSYHHENHVYKSYDLTEAAAVLDELSHYEEDDEGLWQGLAPREAIAAQAAYTYGNAVYDLWRDEVEKLDEHLESFEFEDDAEVYGADAGPPEPLTADDKREAFVRRFIPAYILLTELGDLDLGDVGNAVCRRAYRDLINDGALDALPVLADAIDELGDNRHHLAVELRKLGGVTV